MVKNAEVNKVADIKVNNNKEEMKMVNITNGVNIDEVVNNGVNNNNIKGEMKMVNNNEWIERVEVYVEVKNGRTLTSLIEDGTLAGGSWQRLGFGPDENLEDVQVGDGWVVSIDRVNNLEIIGNPDIKHGTRVYVMNNGDIIEKALYLSVDEDGTVGREDVVYEMRSRDEVVEAAVNKAGLFIREWMRYYNVDISDIGFDDLIKFYKRFTSGKNSYDTIYYETVERLMKQIKDQRELEARLDDDRVYDVDWELNNQHRYDIDEANVADDLNEDHEYYGCSYLTVDWYERYKELDEAYGVLNDFRDHTLKYVFNDRFSSDDWSEYFYNRGVYSEFTNKYWDDVPVVFLADGLARGSYTDEIIKIIKRHVASYMSKYTSDFIDYPKSITEDESGNYLSIIFGGYRETIEVDDVNYTEQDELRVVAELSDTIRGFYETEMVDGYEQRVAKNNKQ